MLALTNTDYLGCLVYFVLLNVNSLDNEVTSFES
jgi:hypothetical protein